MESARQGSIGHPLERSLNAPAADILDAIASGFRAQVDVKGKLAELYLYRLLLRMEQRGVITALEWTDKDGEPDFFLEYAGHRLGIQCKNIRSGEQYKTGDRKGLFKVELQKTRGGIDPATGEKTRYYRADEFNVVGICLFNQTGAWEFLFAAAKDLSLHRDRPDRLEVMHPVPRYAGGIWRDNLLDVLRSLHQ